MHAGCSSFFFFFSQLSVMSPCMPLLVRKMLVKHEEIVAERKVAWLVSKNWLNGVSRNFPHRRDACSCVSLQYRIENLILSFRAENPHRFANLA
ncbi:hypothetical protein GGI43DRAFT_411573 [Trichoderma evansii]